MNQKKKNIRWLSLLGILSLIALILHFSGTERKDTMGNPGMFSVADTASIQKIHITRQKENIVLERTSGTWTVNGAYEADEGIMMVVLTVLRQMEVSRGVSRSQAEEIVEGLKTEGAEVQIYDSKGKISHFYAGGNLTKTLSYFTDNQNGQAWIVNLPGYDSYVAGIFEIPAIDWRRRLLFSSTWRSLLKLNANYPYNPNYDFDIEFFAGFLKMPGIEPLDTAAMMEYIEQFEYFQADRFIEEGMFPHYDSLANTPPEFIIKIEDIDKLKNRTLSLYHRIPGDNNILGVLEDGRKALFNYRRIAGIYARKEDFIAN
ncbi:MAG: hypothetical protein JJU28_02960 [Cyclobacteriaceae bacterium]|nr:hypothetical protein [Cyclobacteriaceae bacterium]